MGIQFYQSFKRIVLPTPYPSYRYYFPPRPEIKIPPSSIPTYERMGFIAQPKLNGSCSVSFIGSPTDVRFMGRHQDTFSRELIPRSDLGALYCGSGHMAVVGEFMNKSKRDGRNQIFNGCLVLFDILVYNGQYLTGTTVLERQELMDTIFKSTPHDEWMDKISNNVYRVKNFTSGFSDLYREAIKVDMIEGFVLKKPGGILEAGYRPGNNVGWQVKCRKSTKNYAY